MELSIIIPIYNAEKTLRRCVESVLGQTYTDYELILIDDGSTDNSPVICNELSLINNLIRVIHHANGSLCAARNSGLSVVKGTFVTFLDADDYIGTGTLQEVMNEFKNHPTCNILEYPVYVHYGSTRQRLLTFENKEHHDVNSYWITYRAYLHSYVCNKIFRVELFRNTRFPVGQVFEDVTTTARLLSISQNIATTDKGLYYYVANPNGITACAGVKELSQLLSAHLDAIRQYFCTDGIPQKDLAIYYLHLVNIQLDLIRGGKTDVSLPRIPIPASILIDRTLSLTTKLKAFIIKTIGENALCKLYSQRK